MSEKKNGGMRQGKCGVDEPYDAACISSRNLITVNANCNNHNTSDNCVFVFIRNVSRGVSASLVCVDFHLLSHTFQINPTISETQCDIKSKFWFYIYQCIYDGILWRIIISNILCLILTI